MAHSHLGHNVQLGRRVILANGVLLAGYVEIGDLAFLGGNACVHQFVRIGRLAMLGGLTAAAKDVPPFCTTRPTALNAVTALNVIGMRRAGMTPTERAEAKEAFRILYRASLNVTQALEAIRGNFQGGPAIEMCDFIAASKRGICRLDDSADDDQAPDPD
jgi:UDP-N-acetylglucosamine acyltransferase